MYGSLNVGTLGLEGLIVNAARRAGTTVAVNTAEAAANTAVNTTARGVHPSTPVGRTGSWQDTSQFTGNTVKANRELNVAGARAGAPPINAPATIGGREYSGHALDRMQQRGYVPSTTCGRCA